MTHVTKGCLAHSQDDIWSDGSRQEGLHKGWNGLQRSFSSGIEIFTALSHDFVLHCNCQIAYNNKDPNPFTVASNGTHHIQLANQNAVLWNNLVASKKNKGRALDNPICELPWLPMVATFGLVKSKYSSSHGGLLKIKEDVVVDEKLLIDEHPADAFDLVEMFQLMNIDAALLNIPLTCTGSQSQPILLDVDSVPLPSTVTLGIVYLTLGEVPAVGSKRKAETTEQDSHPPVDAAAAKRMQFGGFTDVSTPH